MNERSHDLARLIAACAAGDQHAFRDLYHATAPKLLGIVLRIVRTRGEAEEVVQDVYLRIWKNAAGYDPSAGSALAWMASIARNRAIDILRAKTPMTITSADEEADWIARIPDPRDAAAEVADSDALRKCLNTLEPEARDLVVLAYCNGFSREELASRYNRPVNTIKTWLHRGLASLKSCLDAKT